MYHCLQQRGAATSLIQHACSWQVRTMAFCINSKLPSVLDYLVAKSRHAGSAIWRARAVKRRECHYPTQHIQLLALGKMIQHLFLFWASVYDLPLSRGVTPGRRSYRGRPSSHRGEGGSISTYCCVCGKNKNNSKNKKKKNNKKVIPSSPSSGTRPG